MVVVRWWWSFSNTLVLISTCSNQWRRVMHAVQIVGFFVVEGSGKMSLQRFPWMYVLSESRSRSRSRSVGLRHVLLL
ncbi:hypothetical protein GGS20DRAFT_558942 [Poronia punctata]|nr:hypothetical protein GGS20DRAFT_558942 [Poronia punctata]